MCSITSSAKTASYGLDPAGQRARQVEFDQFPAGLVQPRGSRPSRDVGTDDSGDLSLRGLRASSPTRSRRRGPGAGGVTPSRPSRSRINRVRARPQGCRRIKRCRARSRISSAMLSSAIPADQRPITARRPLDVPRLPDDADLDKRPLPFPGARRQCRRAAPFASRKISRRYSPTDPKADQVARA